MPKYPSLSVVIPALNEAATVARCVEALTPLAGRVVLVDDGSSDGTKEIAEKAGAAVVRFETNQGYDRAIAAGVNRAFELGAHAVVTCDADGQHRLDDIERISIPVLEGRVDFCAGVRGFYNRPIEGVAGFFSKALWGTKDPFCGLKCYSRILFDRIGSEFPSNLNIGTLPFVWVKTLHLRSEFIPINVQKRADQPRFGKSVEANFKLANAFLSNVWDHGKQVIGGKT